MNRRNAVVGLFVLGGSAAAPAALAQDKVWRVGFLTLGSASLFARDSESFVKAMRDLGYIEGRNLVIEWRHADGSFERLPDYAAELVRANVDVIVALASGPIGAAQRATRTIPIVMASTGDPVGSGFVKSLSRPGGNITGLSNMNADAAAKLLEVLLNVVPKPGRVAILVTPTSTTYRAITEGLRNAARTTGVDTVVLEATNAEEIQRAFERMAGEKVSAVIVGSSPFFSVQRRQIAELALKHRIPSMFGARFYVEAGGLMSYGANRTDTYVRTAAYVDKILKGAKPADLPVEQASEFELAVNLNTARTLNIAIPQAILLRATHVIR